VANPKKPPQIESILRRNKEKLLVFLQNFHNDKEGMYTLAFASLFLQKTYELSFADEQFTDEKQFLIAQIQGL
jgi:calcium binding protein 39